MNEQATAPEPCNHHWIFHHQGDTPMPFIGQCSQCGHFNAADLHEWFAKAKAEARAEGVEVARKGIAVALGRIYAWQLDGSDQAPGEVVVSRADAIAAAESWTERADV